MATNWYDVMASGDTITYENWNDMVSTIWCHGGISGSYIGHSSNTSIHFPSSNLKNWLDESYAPSGDLNWANLSDISDVSTTVADSGSMLLYNGSQWVPISGTKIYRFSNKPANASDFKGQIIRVSGGTGEKTYVFMSVKNSSDNWEWIQLGVST